MTPCPGCLTVIQTNFAPLGVGVNPVTNRAYVAAENFDRVYVIDGATNAILATIVDLGAPTQIAVNPTTNRIYVAARFANVLRIIDGATNTVVSSVPLPTESCGYSLAVNSSTNRVYVITGCMFPAKVVVIDGQSGAVVESLDLLVNGTGGVAVNSGTNRVYIATSSGLVALDGATNTVLSTTPLNFGVVNASPNRVALNTSTNRAYISNDLGPGMLVVDLSNNATLAFIPGVAAGGAIDIAVNPVNNRVYTRNNAGGLAIIDGSTNTIRVVDLQGNTPFGIAVNPVTNRVYMTERILDRTMVLIDTP